MKMKKENEGGDALVEDDIESINSDEFDMLLSKCFTYFVEICCWFSSQYFIESIQSFLT